MNRCKEWFHCLKMMHSRRVGAVFEMGVRAIKFVLHVVELCLYLDGFIGVKILCFNPDDG